MRVWVWVEVRVKGERRGVMVMAVEGVPYLCTAVFWVFWCISFFQGEGYLPVSQAKRGLMQASQ